MNYPVTGLYCILSTCNVDTIKQTWIIKKKRTFKSSISNDGGSAKKTNAASLNTSHTSDIRIRLS